MKNSTGLSSKALYGVVNTVWVVLIVCLIFMAIYVSLGRHLVDLVGQNKNKIEAWLSDSIGQPVSIGLIEGHWHFLWPSLSLQQIEIYSKPSAVSGVDVDHEPEFVVQFCHIGLDVFETLLDLEPRLSFLHLSGLNLHWVSQQGKTTLIPGLDQLSVGQSKKASEHSEQEKALTYLVSMIDHLIEKRGLILQNIDLQMELEHYNQHVQVKQIALSQVAEKYYVHSNVQLLKDRPVSFSLQSVFRGRLLSPGSWEGLFYVNFDRTDLGFLFQNSQFGEMEITNFDMNLTAWGEFEKSRLRRMSGKATLFDFIVKHSVSSALIEHINRLSTDFVWEMNLEDDWELGFNNIQALDLSDSTIAIDTLFLKGEGLPFLTDTAEVTLQVEQIDLKQVTNFMQQSHFLDLSVRELVKELAVTGIAESLQLNASVRNNHWQDFKVSTHFKSLNAQAIEPWPGVKNVSGFLSISPSGGLLQLATKASELTLSPFFRESWLADKLYGTVAWSFEKSGLSIRSGIIHMQTQDVHAQALLQLWYPQVTEAKKMLNPQLETLVSLYDGQGEKASLYLPIKPVSKDFVAWFDQSVQGGFLENANILFRGPIKPERYLEKTFLMEYEIEKGEFEFLPEWPRVKNAKMTVLQEGRQTFVEIQKADINNAQVSKGFIKIPFYERGKIPYLHLDATFFSDASNGIDFLRRTPLRKHVAGFIDNVAVQGPMNIDLKLVIPLRKKPKEKLAVKADVLVTLEDSAASFKSWQLDLSALEGEFAYKTQQGLSSKGWRAKVLGHNIVGKVSTDATVKGVTKTQVQFFGQVEPTVLENWLKQPIFSFVSGAIDYQAELGLYAIQGSNSERSIPNYVRVYSSLKGTTLSLPKPLTKPPQKPLQTSVQLTLAETRELDIQAENTFAASLKFKPERLESIYLHFGDKKVKSKIHPGVTVTGQLEQVDYDQWKNFYIQYQQVSKKMFERFEKVTQSADFEGIEVSGDKKYRFIRDLTGVVLDIERLNFPTLSLNQVDLQLMSFDEKWHLTLQSEEIVGSMRIPLVYLGVLDRLDWPLMPEQTLFDKYFNQSPIDLELWSLTLPQLAQLKKDFAKNLLMPNQKKPQEISEQQSSILPWSQLSPKWVPPMTINIRNIQLAENDWGAWLLATHVVEDGVEIKKINAHFKDLHVKGKGFWRLQKAGPVTYFMGDISSKDVEKTMVRWGFAPTVSSEKASLVANVKWPGAPLDFAFDRLNGKLAVHVDDGTLLKLDPRTSSVRVVGLLNFETLSRRMQLDFSDVLSKGLAFDVLSGAFEIRETILSTNSFKLKGPSAHFEVKGKVFLDTQSIDQEMVVTIPITRNLVLPAAATGGLPAATAAYVIDKAIGKQLNKLTTLKFEVKGDWLDPKITRKRRF